MYTVKKRQNFQPMITNMMQIGGDSRAGKTKNKKRFKQDNTMHL